MNIKVRKTCRLCGMNNLAPVLSLGEQFVVNFVDGHKKELIKGPLELVLCETKNGGCGLLQLKHTLDRDILYRKYWYKSGVSTEMVKFLRNVVKSTEDLVKLKPGDLVIDIGSNDSTLLKQYKAVGIIKVGFEPSNLWEFGLSEDIRIIHDYFSYDSFVKEFGEKKAKIITSIAMFYDLEDPNEFVTDIEKCLDKNGIWIIQMNYLGLMLKNNTFDNITHEHLEYYCLLSLENLLKRHNMEAFDVKLNEVNGGSFRIYIKHKNGNIKGFNNANQRLEKLRKYEKTIGLLDEKVYEEYEKRINKIKYDVVNFLKRELEKGKKIFIYGASTRGLSFLQYAGIDNKLIETAIDKNPDKWGKYIVGTGIPIISVSYTHLTLPTTPYV